MQALTSTPPAAQPAVQRRRGAALSLLLLALLLSHGCAHPPIDDITASGLETRLQASIARPEGSALALPPGVRLDDGLSEDEAVALALWNDPPFRQALTQLGIARSVWVAAGLLKNPTLSLLFPVGAKQLEFTLAWALDVAWSRGQRMQGARLQWERTAHELVELGLERATLVRLAYADALAARGQAALAWEAVGLAQQRDRIQQRRLAVGELTPQQAGLARVASLAAREAALSADADAESAGRALLRSTGLAPFDPPSVTPPNAGRLPEPQALERCLERAQSSRPALEAARLGLESAGAQLGLERWQVLHVAAVLDANADGQKGFEIGPGLQLEIPLFDRNQAGVLRARSELEAALWALRNAERSVRFEVLEGHAAYVRALARLRAWRREALPAAETEAALVSEHVRRGGASFDEALDARGRRLSVLEQELLLEREARRALVTLERSIGGKLDASA